MSFFFKYSARRHELCTSWMATARMETTCGPTYSIARVIGATIWQKKSFIGRCHYLRCYSQWKSLVTWTDLCNGHINEGYRMSQKTARVPPQCRHVLQSTRCARHVCMQRPYRLGMTCLLDKLPRPSFWIVHISADCVSYTVAWGFMLSHILIMVMCMQLLCVLHMHSLRLIPQCPIFH